jgi:uncharacterized SAM-binding protein YcdF (DUF218 family)
MDLAALILYGICHQSDPSLGNETVKNKILYSIFILSILVIVDIIASFLWFKAVVEKENSRFKEKADAGVLFMGSFNKNYTELGKDTLRRIRHGRDLYESGLIDKILCVGGTRSKIQVFGSIMMKDRLIGQGVPSEKIIAETESYDSVSNWQMTEKLIEKNHWKIVAIISSPLHVYRLRKIISEKTMPELKIFYSPYSYQAYEDTPLKLSLIEMWRQVQHEWVAYLTTAILPDSVYRSMLRVIRLQRAALFSSNSQSSSTIF